MSKIGFSLGYRIMWGFLALFLMVQAFWVGVMVASGGLSLPIFVFIGLASIVLVLTLIVAGRPEKGDAS